MKKSFWNRRIPTLFAILVLVLGIGATTFLVQKGGYLPISATPSEEPKDVRISNITDASFTVSYFTNDRTTGAINYGTSANLGQSALDDRDQEFGKIESRKIHNFTIRNLSAVTKYYFVIISGKGNYTNNSSPFEVTTGPVISGEPPSQDPMSGIVIKPDGIPPEEALIYVVAEGSQVISTLTKPDGTFVLPLNSLKTSDLSSYFALELDTSFKLLSIGDGMFSNVKLSSLQAHPVPTFTLSNDYDFTIASAPQASASSQLSGFPPFEIRQATKEGPKILTPQKDQEFTDQKPQFKGTAIPNEEVQIVINSEEQIQTTVKADGNGNWVYRPQNDLSPGEHTITITTKDSSGIIKIIKQSFTVYASGTQISGDKGSPTPTPQPSITATPTPTPALSISAEPTQVLLTATPTQAPAQNLVITATPTLAPTGNSSIITFSIVGLLVTLFGGLIFLLTRGAI
ncbi:MAG: hypothetical protein A2798_00855 [Candidatus Levybacteria bacterium RIFCSPHIGHO2_01_FULL_37_17]|nr:MAG: hypothetical protein A2798_00855 [Candidatus Levybacteria bacterium RIFCSPHIGHO2_01_FULL_37_17]OGH37000.1 MAG: hypothetical protein A2959_01715 [Candidatus Levybacteria bacterium RIFCSPLOWO2_01_FULL_38_23]